MRLSLSIAFRYLFAKKSHNVINIIAAIIRMAHGGFFYLRKMPKVSEYRMSYTPRSLMG